MIIGIKYCGGCNPRYDRVAKVEQLKAELPQHSYVSALTTSDCDVWLVVCGCPAACADRSALKAKKRLFLLHTPESFTEAAQWLKVQVLL